VTARASVGRALTAHGSAQLDWAIAGAVATADVIGIVVAVARGDVTAGPAAGLSLVMAGCVMALARWRRQRPLRTVLVVFVGTIMGSAIAPHGLLSQRTAAQIAIVAFALGSWSTRRRTAFAVVAVAATLVCLGAAHSSKNWAGAATAAVAVLIAPWLAGAAARLRRIHLAEVEARLARADSDREERARRAVLDERARIARELHDVVAHHVSLIGVQAGAARTMLGSDDDNTREALTGIEASSRDAVREMRRLVDVLDTGDGVEFMAPPRRRDLEDLCAGFEAAGLTVTRRLDPVVDLLGAALGLTVYRIVEEALTNVTRHSTARQCGVEVAPLDARLHVMVDDQGPSQLRAPIPPPGAGRGLAGMRERVALFGGDLTVGPVGGGYRVEAWLPLDLK
jgi:signal transduction histidine kinase